MFDLINLVIIKGAGDLASGVAHRLYQAGLPVLLTDLPRPTAIRRTVAFSQAVYDGEVTVEGLTAVKAGKHNYKGIMAAGCLPVLPDADQKWIDDSGADVLVEATLSKKNTGISLKPGRITIALGPGYEAGKDVDAIVETARGHFLGRVILEGPAKPDTGKPGLIGGYEMERLVKAPAPGEVRFLKSIGDRVESGEVIGRAGGVDIVAAISGVLRGALPDGLEVPAGFKIGDIDPRPESASFIHSHSDKARAIGGGVLEAILYFTCGAGRDKIKRM